MILTDPIKAWLNYAAGIAAILLFIFMFWLWNSRQSLKLEVANLKTGTALAGAANDSNLVTIAALGAQLATWEKAAKDAAFLAVTAAAQAQAAQVAREKASAALRAREAADKALPACDAFLATDIAKICPAHAAAIKERAQ